MNFLDLNIGIQDGNVTTSLYRKPTATNSLLHYDSFHPQHQKRAIPLGQFTRLKRNCSNPLDFQSQARMLTQRFKQRGYPRQTISRAFQQVKQTTRNNLLCPKTREPDHTLRIVTPYNNQWSDLRNILFRNWNILTSDTRTAPHVPARPALTAKRARNLKDRITRSHFSRPLTSTGTGVKFKGSFPCGNCTICPYMLDGKEFINPANGNKILLTDYVNCRTKHVVYGIICPCPKLYIGQTSQEVRKRTQQHLSNISLAKRDDSLGKNLTSIAKHFLQEHRGNPRGSKIVGLKKIWPNPRGGDITPRLLQLETRWIHDLNSLAPAGLNEEMLFTGFYKRDHLHHVIDRTQIALHDSTFKNVVLSVHDVEGSSMEHAFQLYYRHHSQNLLDWTLLVTHGLAFYVFSHGHNGSRLSEPYLTGPHLPLVYF